MAERRRKVAARDRADRLAVRDDRRALTRWSPTLDAESRQQPLRALLALTLEWRAASERSLVPAHDPAEARLQWRDARTEFVTVQRKSGLEPQGVASAEACGRHPGIEHRLPELRRAGDGYVHFQSVLAGIARARNDAIVTVP